MLPLLLPVKPDSSLENRARYILNILRRRVLGCSQSEEDCHAFWNPEEGERDPISLMYSGIACKPLLP